MVAVDRSTQKLVDLNEGIVSREIFCNQDIYDQEMEQVFLRSWLFVGHESQIPKPGDFFMSRMGEEQVIVTRDKQNRVQVLLNSCRHRGNSVCRYDQGNQTIFTCSFHGWSYDSTGSLVGLPFHDGGYNEMAKREWGLAAARVELFQGSIWATWDHSAPSFMDYLGGADVYLKTQLLGTDGSHNGAEVVGGIVKWRLGCNWKVPTPDVDRTHGWITHKSLVDAFSVGPTGIPVRQGEGGRREGPSGPNRSYCVAFPEGHTMGVTIPSEDDPSWADSKLWDDQPLVREYLREKYEIRKQRLGKMASLSVGPAIFPNEGWLGRVIRIMHPQGPLMTEIWTYFFVDKDAPQAVKDTLAAYYEHWYGPGGMTQQDDMENWYNLTISSKGPKARTLPLNYQLTLSTPPIHGPTEFGMPGLFTPIYSDENHRRFYQRWAEFMQASDWSELKCATRPGKGDGMTEALTDQDIRLRFEVEDFLYREADLLDDHEYERWLDLFTEDARYWMPMKRNVSSEEMETENTQERHEMAWFDEGKPTLIMRVQQIRTGTHWAEEPYSRISHLVTNVRILSSTENEVRVKCRFIVYRNRMVDEESLFVGKRVDTLRRAGNSWQIARREIYLDQSVMLSKNFTNFF